MDIALRGGCLCRAITYTAVYAPTSEEIEHPEPGILTRDGKMHANHCHCDTCRISSGALFQTLAQIPTKRIDIVDSKNTLTTFRVSVNAERQHCGICGISLWIKDTGWDDPDKGFINVSVGSMEKVDAKKWVQLRHHIFMGDTIDGGVWEFEDKLSKWVWCGVSDGRYETWSDRGEWKRT